MRFFLEFDFFGLVLLILGALALPAFFLFWLFEKKRHNQLKNEVETALFTLKPQPPDRDREAYLNFISNISHEVSNPLQGILGALANLRQTSADSPYLDQIEEDTHRLSRLVTGLKLLAQLDAPQAPLLAQPVQIRSVVADVIMREADRATAQGIDLVYQGPDPPPRVLANRDQLTQVLCNLVDNSLKYSRPSSQEIAIAVKPLPASNQLQVTVSDDGAGISPAMLPYVFEQAFRLPDARTRQKAGSGLGLPIVKRIIEHHRGEITIDSIYGQGSIVTFTLPLTSATDTS